MDSLVRSIAGGGDGKEHARDADIGGPLGLVVVKGRSCLVG